MTPTTDQLKDLLDKVTPGEWEFFDDNGYDRSGVEIPHDSCNDGAATLIALAPTLAAEVVRLRELLGWLDDMLFEHGFSYDGSMRVRISQALDATSAK